MSSFDVRVFAIRHRPGRKTFEVRWRVAGRDRSRSFIFRALADGYRAELVRAARKGLAFAPGTGEPESWAAPEPELVTWYQHAVAYAEMKWPHLAPHSRASLADALATVTPLLTRETSRRPPARHCAPPCTGMPSTPGGAAALLDRTRPARWPGWSGPPCRSASSATRASSGLPWTGCAHGWTARPPQRTRSPASGQCSTAPSATPSSSGCCPPTPPAVRWRAPRAAAAVSPVTVASPAQVRAILAQVSRIKPELAAFFGCLCYAALRPEEAVTLRRADLILPAHGHGKIILTTACPRTGAAWTNTGTPFEPRGPSTALTAPSASSPSRPSWSACSAVTSATMAPRRTGGCSAAPAAAWSASRSTAAPGTPPARQRSARTWPPPRSPAAPTTCGTPPCRYG